jgi:transcription elongation factor GreA
MTSTERLWMTREAHTRLKTELAALRSQRGIEVPEDFMDYDDNLMAAHLARQARIHQIQELLGNAVVGEDPPDDGIAEPGMVLTVRYDDTSEIETFLLGVRGVEDADIDVYSMQSPLGRAIAGAHVGEQRTYSIPSGANLPVTLLKAVPYGMHTPKPLRPQLPSPARRQAHKDSASFPCRNLTDPGATNINAPPLQAHRCMPDALLAKRTMRPTTTHAEALASRQIRQCAGELAQRKELTWPPRHVSGSRRKPTSGYTANWTPCVSCSQPESPMRTPTKTSPPSDAHGRHECNRFMTS